MAGRVAALGDSHSEAGAPAALILTRVECPAGYDVLPLNPAGQMTAIRGPGH